VAQKLVELKTDFFSRRTDQSGWGRISALGLAGDVSKGLWNAHQRIASVAELKHGLVLDPMNSAGTELEDFSYMFQRENEELLLAADEESIEHQNRFPDGDGKMYFSAYSRGRFHIHPASIFFRHRPYHIHPDAAAGHVRNLFCGGKARVEDQLDCFVAGEFFGLLGRKDPFFDGFLAESIRGDASAVVFDANADPMAVPFGFEQEDADFVCTAGASLLGRFDAVIDGVAY